MRLGPQVDRAHSVKQQMVTELSPADFAHEGALALPLPKPAERGGNLTRPDFAEMQVRRQPARSRFARRIAVFAIRRRAVVQEALEPLQSAFFSGLPCVVEGRRPAMAPQVPGFEPLARRPRCGRNRRRRRRARGIGFQPQALTPERGEDAIRRTLSGADGPWLEQKRGVERTRLHPVLAAVRLDLPVPFGGAGVVKAVPRDRPRLRLLRKRGDYPLGRAATENQAAVQAFQGLAEGGETAMQPPARSRAETAIAGFQDEDRDDRSPGFSGPRERGIVRKPQVPAEPDKYRAAIFRHYRL